MTKRKKHSSKQPDLVLGTMPVDVLNKTFNLELAPGIVILTWAAQRHAARKHPNEYSICLPHIATIIQQPLYVGDDYDNHENIELISKIRTINLAILDAINITLNKGCYEIRSFYPISDAKIQSRKEKGFLFVA